ncbi:hypothetical protein PENANT_c152G11231, partial [Penicillium antarcticum]
GHHQKTPAYSPDAHGETSLKKPQIGEYPEERGYKDSRAGPAEQGHISASASTHPWTLLVIGVSTALSQPDLITEWANLADQPLE